MICSLVLGAGTVIAGYRVEGLLGRGGMGVVYEATQLSLNRKVALKLLSSELSGDEAFASRFRREAELQAGLDHPHVVTVHEAGESELGLYIAMRLVRGGTLRERILAGGADPMSWVAILRAIASALDAAHETGLIHRDVKPANILIDTRGHAYLSDFGITKAAEGTTLTASGQVMGTPDYIPPEQVEGGKAIPAGDIYALAAVAFECLTGAGPFPRDTPMAILFAHVHHPPPSATERDPSLGAAVDAALARGLAKNPADRPPTAGAFVEELAAALAQRPAGAQTTAVPRPAPTAIEPTTPLPSPPAGTGAPPSAPFEATAPAGTPAAPFGTAAAPLAAAATGAAPGAPAADAAPFGSGPAATPPPPPRGGRRSRGPLLAGAALLAVIAVVAAVLLAGGGGGGGDGEEEASGGGGAPDAPLGSAEGTSRLGSPLLEDGERGPCFGEGSGQNDACTALQTELPGEELIAPADSVIVRWGVRNATGRLRLQVLRQDGDKYMQVNVSDEVMATGKTDYFPARVAISNGDTIALFGYRNAQAAIISGEGSLGRFKPPLTEEPRVFDYTPEQGFHILFGAEIEPDADSDAWGDTTQDKCPGERGDDDGCAG